MGRTSRFSREDVIGAAITLIGRDGPGGLSIAGIGELLGAPTGSIYYRFKSLEQIQAEAWLDTVESFQAGFLENLKQPGCDGLDAALYTPGWARENPESAAVLLRYRREDLVKGDWPDSLRIRAQRVGRTLRVGLRNYIKERYENPTDRQKALVRFALIDMPYAALRPHVGKTIPAFVDEIIKTSFRAVMEEL